MDNIERLSRIVADEEGRGWSVYVPSLDPEEETSGYVDTVPTLAEAAQILMNAEIEEMQRHLQKNTRALLAQEVELVKVKEQANKALQNLEGAKSTADAALNQTRSFVSRHGEELEGF